MSRPPAETQSPPIENFLATVLAYIVYRSWRSIRGVALTGYDIVQSRTDKNHSVCTSGVQDPDFGVHSGRILRFFLDSDWISLPFQPNPGYPN